VADKPSEQGAYRKRFVFFDTSGRDSQMFLLRSLPKENIIICLLTSTVSDYHLFNNQYG
jgi:hypothetical protein